MFYALAISGWVLTAFVGMVFFKAGKFKLTALIQRRMVEIMQGARPLVERKKGMTDMELVVQEILEDKIAIDYENCDVTTPANLLK